MVSSAVQTALGSRLCRETQVSEQDESKTIPRDRQAELEDALTRGELRDLPPNQPKGLLGERGPSLYKTDTFEPDMNAGVSQENDAPVVQLVIVLAFLLFFPVGFWLLWRTPLYSTRAKLLLSGVALAAIAFVYWRVFAS